MAITASYCVRNGSGGITTNDATASQTLNLGDRPGEKVVLCVENTNTTSQTATVTVLSGDFLANSIGSFAASVAPGGKSALGPFETTRFKNSASEITVQVAVTASGTVSNVKLEVIKLP